MKVLVIGVFVVAAICLPQDDRSKRSRMIRKLKMRFTDNHVLVRLVGSIRPYEGNVEVNHKGTWGTICDDNWDISDANVVCRSLGYLSALEATHNSQFVSIKTPYLLDNVYCKGTEVSLGQCIHDGWGFNDCSPDEIAGVICLPDEPISSLNLRKVRPKKLEGYVRLFGGRHKKEGAIEIFSIEDNNWIGLCGNGWSLKEAIVVCKQLHLGFASHAYHLENENVTIGLSGVECIGTEDSLANCSADFYTSCSEGLLAAVICTDYISDLELDKEVIMRSAYLEDRPLYLLTCAMEENCLASSAYGETSNDLIETRRLLRFTTAVSNRGTADFTPFAPKHTWQFHQCHMHYHSMEVFATFDIIKDGVKVAEGHKASFCLEDNKCLRDSSPRYACAAFGDQGISVNCTDIYKHNIDCQWIDVTDVTPGIYSLKVAVNPEYKIAEMRFDNNAVLCTLYYGERYAVVYDCIYTSP